jgi:Tol biopolymer transport system component
MALVRLQLDRILASGIFRRSKRLSAFLRYVVEQTLDGQADILKEQVLGAELYGKGPEFDGAADPIVRVDARRLRDKLREYYSESPWNPIKISLPKGSYVPVFEENPSPVILVPGPAPRIVQVPGRVRWPWFATAAVLAVATGAVASWSVLRQHSKPNRAVPILSSFYGVSPGISPDGRFVAFSSKGPEESGKADIWVRTIDGVGLRRLTKTPQFTETFPAWSPDGREISFTREGQGIWVVPESGGVERRISSGTWADWSPDGKSLIIRDREREGPFGIYQVFLETRERRALTQPLLGDGDWRAAVSPDGSSLAFTRFEPSGGGDLYVVPMQGGEPRRVTNWNARITGVVWTPDGGELIYSKDELWRISANLARPGRGSPVEGGSLTANNLSIVRPHPGQPARLVFQTFQRELSFRIVDMSMPLSEGMFRAAKPFPVSTLLEYPGPFAPDSRHFAFVTERPPKIEVSDTDGASLVAIAAFTANRTDLGTTSPVLGSWSPDGRKIVYTAVIDGNRDIFVADTSGGSPRRMTFGASEESFASWSRDGRWIYFSSNRGGAAQDIWRIPANGGASVRITYHGGVRPQEAPDGNLYYADRYPPNELMGRPTGTARLMRVPSGGGPETAVLDGLTPDWWSVSDDGVLFISREPEFDAIDRYSFSSHKVTRVGRLAPPAGLFGGQLHVSPDGRWALVTTHRGHSGLMRIDNFH